MDLREPHYYLWMARHHLDCLEAYRTDPEVPEHIWVEVLAPSYTRSALDNLLQMEKAVGRWGWC